MRTCWTFGVAQVRADCSLQCRAYHFEVQDVCGTDASEEPSDLFLLEKLKNYPTPPEQEPSYSLSRTLGGGKAVFSNPTTLWRMANPRTSASHDKEGDPATHASSV